MENYENIVSEIYEKSGEDLPELATREINKATCLIEKYANKIVKKTDLKNNRWVLLNILHVLYKDIFLLQTEDFEKIIKSNPKKLEKSLEKNAIYVIKNYHVS